MTHKAIIQFLKWDIVIENKQQCSYVISSLSYNRSDRRLITWEKTLPDSKKTYNRYLTDNLINKYQNLNPRALNNNKNRIKYYWVSSFTKNF